MLKLTKRKFSKSVGSITHGWKLKKTDYIPEFKFKSYELQHEKTGADYFHIETQDKNNFFSISFTTPPNDSKGIPHVLEHTALCGSEKFPVRDPFFNMLKRSLNTYMNAWTYSDHTTYPFASQNETDFYNLCSVYLDATLKPKLTENDFKQEGHRLEFEKMEDPTSPLMLKGIVFNEMKGAMGDSAQYFARKLQQYMYPNSPYAYNSGGDPEEVIKMKYEDLKNFHSTYYHPSNSKIYTYGDLPLEKHLEFTDKVISQFDYKKHDNPFNVIERPEKDMKFFIKGPPEQIVNDAEKQTKFAIGYVLEPKIDSFESFALSFMLDLMLDEPRGVFYQKLIDSGIATDFVPGTGFDSDISQLNFIVGVQGISKDQVELVEKTIQECFELVSKEGIDPQLVESALHRYELSIKKKSPHFGVSSCSSVISKWIHGDNPVQTFFANQKIEKLNEELKNPDFFQNMIKKHFLQNVKISLQMEPDEEFVKNQNEIEKNFLKDIVLTDELKEKLVKEAIEMKNEQEKQADVSCLPTLKISDIEREIPEKLNIKQSSNIYFNEQITNQINTVKIQNLIPNDIPQELLSYLPLFSYVLTKIGTEKMNHLELTNQIELNTAGISSTINIIPDLTKFNDFKMTLDFNSYCLDRKTDKMIEIITEIFLSPKFLNDLDYLKNLIDQLSMYESNSIMRSGSKYAKINASSNLSNSSLMEEKFEGISSVHFINNISSNEKIEEIAEKLQKIATLILRKNNTRVLLTAEASQYDSFSKSVNNIFLNSLKDEKIKESKLPAFESKNSKNFIGIPSQVNFCSQSQIGVEYMNDDFPVVNLVSKIISSSYLHAEIREKGGAYGSGASIGLNGLFSYTSYRDPNVTNTLDVFKKSADWMMNHEITDKELNEAKFLVFQDLDSPVSPAAKAYSNFVYGFDDEFKQKRRNILLDCEKKDLIRVCEKYLVNPKLTSISVLGSKDEIPEIIKESNEWNKH